MGQRGFGIRWSLYTAEVLAEAKRREADFVNIILPVVIRRAKYRFRHQLPDWREDSIAEAVALSWRFFLDCVRKDQDPLDPARLNGHLKYVVAQVWRFRFLCGEDSRTSPLNLNCRQRHNLKRISGPDLAQLVGFKGCRLWS
jgi:hypothetical protein